VVDELTALAGFTDFRKLDEGFAATNRLRTEGTDHLLEGIRGLPLSSDRGPVLRRPGFYARTGGPVKTEQDPSTRIPRRLAADLEAMRYLE
jgi:2-alkyl-3-oxoalkanoate reductase